MLAVRPALLVALAACSSGAAPAPGVGAPIRFLHTYNVRETELVNQVIAERGLAVESSLVPFARGQQVIAMILGTRHGCPDLIRIDATWLPALVAKDLVRPVPQGLVALDWTPEAAALAQVPIGTWHAVPQSVDGLVVVRDRASPPPIDASVDALVAAARAARTEHTRYPLGLRADGYWLVPWLRADGHDLQPPLDPADRATATAFETFAALFGDLVPPPPAAGSETPDELHRWATHGVAYWVTGPWQLGGLPDRDRVAVSGLAHAPRGGQLLVVPTCAERPDAGWRLARELVDVPVEQQFAEAFVTVPTRVAALAAAPPLVHAIADALRIAEPLPRAAITPLLFDDLNPALAAIVAHDATAKEAMAGVQRGWARIARPPEDPRPLPKEDR